MSVIDAMASRLNQLEKEKEAMKEELSHINWKYKRLLKEVAEREDICTCVKYYGAKKKKKRIAIV